MFSMGFRSSLEEEKIGGRDQHTDFEGIDSKSRNPESRRETISFRLEKSFKTQTSNETKRIKVKVRKT